MSHQNKLFKLFHFTGFILIFLLIISVSCDKETDMGNGVQPESDRMYLTYTDTLEINTFTASEDSLTSYSNSLSLLGSYIDPVFGIADASFLSQLRLSSNNVTFDESSDGQTVADSVVLTLVLRGTYGDASTSQNISVYRLNQSIYVDSIYYSDIQADNYYQAADLLGTINYIPANVDTLLNIKLDISVAEMLLNEDTLTYTNNETFLEFFKGIYVKTDQATSGGAIASFDLLSDSSLMTLHYKDNGTAKSFNFLINKYCARINSYQHDYTGAAFSGHIDDAFQDSVVYLQGLGGVKARLIFPNIDYWRGITNIAINKAELYIPIEMKESSLDDFGIPIDLTLRIINDDYTQQLVPDDPYYNSNNDYFNGAYNSDEKAYRLNITRYFQYLINGTYSDNGLFLYPLEKRISAKRVVINSGQHSNKMKLLVTYTKIL